MKCLTFVHYFTRLPRVRAKATEIKAILLPIFHFPHKKREGGIFPSSSFLVLLRRFNVRYFSLFRLDLFIASRSQSRLTHSLNTTGNGGSDNSSQLLIRVTFLLVKVQSELRSRAFACSFTVLTRVNIADSSSSVYQPYQLLTLSLE